MSASAISGFRLGLIYFVGLVNLAIGGLYVAFGLWILLAGANAVAALFQARDAAGQVAAQVPANAEGVKTFNDLLNLASQGLSGVILALASIIAGCSIAQGLPLVLVGAGVLLRQRWARVFALFFAALALLEGVACLASKDATPLVLLAGAVLVAYGVVSFVGLLGRRASNFFAGRDRAAVPDGHATGHPVAWAAGVLVLVATGVAIGAWFVNRPVPPAQPLAKAPDGKQPQPVQVDPNDPAREKVAARVKAIETGDTDAIDRIWRPASDDAKADLLRRRDQDGKSLLMHAAAKGDPTPVMLLQQTIRQRSLNGQVAVTDKRQRTALHYAAEGGHVETLQKLLDMVSLGWLSCQPDPANANAVHRFRCVRQRDAEGKTALDLAQDKRHKDAAELLKKYVVEHYLAPTTPGTTVLDIACWEGERPLVKELLKTGCPLMPAPEHYKNGWDTPLMYATRAGHLLVVKTLLDSFGGDRAKREEYVNFRPSNATSALHVAVTMNQPEIASLLRKHGAKEK